MARRVRGWRGGWSVVLAGLCGLCGCGSSTPFPGGLSTAAPLPVTSTLLPGAAVSGSGGFTLTVAGSGFTSRSVVDWNGTGRATTYVSAGELTAAISAGDVASVGTAQVSVETSAPGGGVSQALGFAVTPAPPVNVFYVAPGGLDTNAGTLAAPFLTIQRCASLAVAGQSCEVRAGTYHETVTPNSGVRIAPYNGEVATVDGADAVLGWSVYQGAIYQAKVALAGDDTNQLFVGQQMMTEARWPNGSDLFRVKWATAQVGTLPTQILDSNLPALDWTGAKVHLWSGTDPFGQQTTPVLSSGAGRLGISVETLSCPYVCPGAGGLYYLYGTLAALDEPGEWFYDAAHGVLYFWAPGGVNPATLDVRAKRRPYGFDLSGRSKVTVQGMNLFAGSVKMDAGSSGNVLDGLKARYVSHYTEMPSTPGDTTGFSYVYTHTLDSGIILDGVGNSLINSTVAWSAANGVTVLGTGSTVSNNLISNVDYLADFSAGVVIAGANTQVEHNTLHTLGRQAIFYYTVTGEDVGFNNLYNAMYLSRDGGEIYACCDQVATGTRIHHNWVHDTHTVTPGAADNYAMAGIYIDNADAGFEVDQNVTWNNELANIFLNGDGETPPNNNFVHNNSIPDVAAGGYIWISGIVNCGTTNVTNNQVQVPVLQATTCSATNNNASAAGAFEMTPSVAVGCNFSGCESAGPPQVVNGLVAPSIVLAPYDQTVMAGQAVTFQVTAAGSPGLNYQWLENGAILAGATGASYTVSAANVGLQGASFQVTVSNGVGSVTCAAATLTVQ